MATSTTGQGKKEERVLGDQYVDWNPLEPRWDDIHRMPEDVEYRRNPRHIKKVFDQWYVCAKRSQSESVKSFYTNLLVRIATTGRHLWENMVHKIEVDQSLATFPKVHHTAAAKQQAAKQGAQKRRADEQNGSAARTPLSAVGKRKGRKPNDEDEDMSDNSSDSDYS